MNNHTSINNNFNKIQSGSENHLNSNKQKNEISEITQKTTLLTAIFFNALKGAGIGIVGGGLFNLATGGAAFSAILIGGIGGALIGGLIGLISFLYKSKVSVKNDNNVNERSDDKNLPNANPSKPIVTDQDRNSSYIKVNIEC